MNEELYIAHYTLQSTYVTTSTRIVSHEVAKSQQMEPNSILYTLFGHYLAHFHLYFNYGLIN